MKLSVSAEITWKNRPSSESSGISDLPKSRRRRNTAGIGFVSHGAVMTATSPAALLAMPRELALFRTLRREAAPRRIPIFPQHPSLPKFGFVLHRTPRHSHSPPSRGQALAFSSVGIWLCFARCPKVFGLHARKLALFRTIRRTSRSAYVVPKARPTIGFVCCIWVT